MKGPKFIVNGDHPVQPHLKSPPEEERKTTQVTLAVSTVEVEKPIIKLERFSNINRLLNATSYVFRFLHRKTGGRGPPDAEERRAAQKFLIKEDQEAFFSKEKQDLKEKGAVSKQSSLAPLNPKLQDGVIITKARVQTEPDMVIMHNKSQLTKLLIIEVHKRNLHSGVSHTLNHLRQNFWILKGFATVKAVVKNCVVCQRANTRLAGQQMAPLPEWRTTPSPPFTHVGVDYAGPLFVTKTGQQKRYI